MGGCGAWGRLAAIRQKLTFSNPHFSALYAHPIKFGSSECPIDALHWRWGGGLAGYPPSCMSNMATPQLGQSAALPHAPLGWRACH